MVNIRTTCFDIKTSRRCVHTIQSRLVSSASNSSSPVPITSLFLLPNALTLLPAYLYQKVERAQPESLLNTKFSPSCDNKCSASYFTPCFLFFVVVVIIIIFIIIISILLTPTSFPTNTSVFLCQKRYEDHISNQRDAIFMLIY